MQLPSSSPLFSRPAEAVDHQGTTFDNFDDEYWFGLDTHHCWISKLTFYLALTSTSLYRAILISHQPQLRLLAQPGNPPLAYMLKCGRLFTLDVVQVVWKRVVRDKQDIDGDLTKNLNLKEVGSCS